ncbi:MAG: mevalonate kinase [Candidatus Peribacteraceae bacterium]|nr:mevalonate kinase [Candidatus Peribacteraceae bacterium]
MTASAPGKLMLFGEHAVLFGFPCIVTAVGQRMRVTVELIDEAEFQLDAPDVKVTGYRKKISEIGLGEIPKGAKFVEQAVKNFIGTFGNFKGGVRIVTQSEFSSEFGFGSSSASTVCAIGALMQLVQGRIDQRALFDLAYKTVLDIQGKGSGYDIAAAIWGGTLLFQAGGKIIEPLQVHDIPLIIGYSGQKYETVKVIDEVKKLHDRFPEKIDAAYRDMGALVPLAKNALEKSDWPRVGALMNDNQRLLEMLEVSSPKLSAMIDAAREAGVFGAKISGSGKGDCIVALAASGKRQAISDKISTVGGSVIDVPCNVVGLRIESR